MISFETFFHFLFGIEFWAVDNILKKQIVNSKKFDLMNVNASKECFIMPK